MDTAIRALNKWSTFNIEYCEQPTLSLSGLAQVKTSSPIAIAADESVRSKKDLESIIEQNAADVVILKPMLIGAFSTIWEMETIADHAGMKTVMTTSLEAAVGRRACAELSAHIINRKRACGLGTGRLFAQDISFNSDLFSDGNYDLRGAAGTIDNINFTALEEVNF